MNRAKILLVDLETAPNLGYFWGLFNQNIGLPMLKDRGYVLCYKAKWLGSKKQLGDSIWNHPAHFNKYPKCDKKIAESLWKLLNEADIVVAHNGRRFDLQWANYLFLKHGLGPCDPFKIVDTLEAARLFRFVSKKLENIAIELFKDHKLEHGGINLWFNAMSGVKKYCNLMDKYCWKDVLLLERAYVEFRPYMKTHPNVNLYAPIDVPRCPVCASDELRHKGYTPLGKSLYPRYKCLSCNHPFRLGPNKLTKVERDKLGVSLR